MDLADQAWLWAGAQWLGEERSGSTYDDRVCSPEATWFSIQRALEAYGVTRVGRLTGLDRLGIPVWSAVRPNSKSLVVAQGKGATDWHAKVSAAMESIERAVAEEPSAPTEWTTAADLHRAGYRAALLPDHLAAGAEPLTENEAVAWIGGYDLLQEQEVWVPLDAVRLDRTQSGRFWQSSDGLASGNIVAEAVLHALLERIERDAETLWGLRPLSKRAGTCTDPASIGDELLSLLCRRIGEAGLVLRVFNMTSDSGIPAFTCLLAEERTARDPNALFVDVTNGSGAHPNPARAAIRAVTEAAQSRLTFISAARDDIMPEAFRRPLAGHVREELAATPRPFRGSPGSYCANLATLLSAVLGGVAATGTKSAIIVPLSLPHQPFAVVKAILPGLEHPDGRRRTRIGARAVARILGAA